MPLALFCFFVVSSPLAGQNQRPLRLEVADETGRLSMRVRGLFRDAELTQALHSGLPMRIQIVAELWRDGFFDSQRGRADWRASVIFDPLESRYRVSAGTVGSIETSVDSLPDVAQALQDFFDLPLRPQESGKYYYDVQVVVETLSLSDLEELQRWLRGDLSPSAADAREDETSMGRGFRKLLVRILGLPARRYRLRSPTFEIEVRSPG